MNLHLQQELYQLRLKDVRFDEPMSRHTTMGVGGPTCLVIPGSLPELKKILKWLYNREVSHYFAGSGSNLLVSDEGFDGVVISLKGALKSITIDDSLIITAEAGAMLGTLVRKAISRNIENLESLIGVPGTVGGALAMNAGAFGREISQMLQEVMVYNTAGAEKIYVASDLEFSYRSSSFKSDEIIVLARFQGVEGDPDTIKEHRDIVSRQRRALQPLKHRSAGSIFKNPDGPLAAGYMIDQVGLKGTVHGDAEISSKHANFIINRGHASAADISALIELIQEKVEAKFNVALKLEVCLLGFKTEMSTC